MENKLEKNLRFIITWGCALSGGALAATLQSFRVPLSFHFSGYTLIAFVLGFLVFWAYWKSFFIEQRNQQQKIFWILINLVVIAGGLAGVFYPLRFVERTQMRQLTIGLITAGLALSGVAFLLVSCKRFFDEDERNSAPEN